MAGFEWFIAWRYLFSRERKALVSVITLISVMGVAVGVAALIVVIGVMDGADDMLFGRIASLYPHVRIVDTRPGEQTVDAALLERLRDDPRVAVAAPVLEKKTLLQSAAGGDDKPMFVQLIGVDRVGKGSLFMLHEELTDTTIELHKGEILLGYVAGVSNGVFPGMELLATSTSPVATALGPVVKTLRLRVRLLFRTGVFDFDGATAFVNPETFRELYRTGKGADYIHVKLNNAFKADAFKADYPLPDYYKVSTWREENHEFFGALKLERLGLGLTLLLTVLVAAFNIIGTLILTVIEKTREIGLLRALGASDRSIRRIFLLDGVAVGLVGTAIGAVTGVGLCLTLRAIKLPLPEAVYSFDTMPVEIKIPTILLVMASAMLICTTAALYPAWQAARLDPVEALRFD